MREKFMMAGLGIVMVMGLMFAGCGSSPGPSQSVSTETEVSETDTEQMTSESEPAVSNIDIPEDSILRFQEDKGAAQLMEEMSNGQIPAQASALYDQMGGLPVVTVTDPATIQELYNRFSQMKVGQESQMSITDCYHFISFQLQDGTYAGWRFEGEGLLCWGPDNYEVLDAGNLWPYVRQLQDKIMEQD